MQIVIDIPKHIYEHIKEVYEHSLTVEATYSYIYYGTPLPKGHGRLIDADTLEECKEVMNTIMNECEYAVRMDEVRNVPTIIEADKAERSEKDELEQELIVDGKVYVAKEPRVKTIHDKTGEVVIGGFQEVS